MNVLSPVVSNRHEDLTIKHGSILNRFIRKEYSTMAKAKTARTATTPNPKVTSISGPSLASEGKRKQPTVDVEGAIRQRAYELYVQRGFEPGHENDDWLVAEREILSSSDAQQSA
jgi:Protein of unknown function (DUF2934)